MRRDVALLIGIGLVFISITPRASAQERKATTVAEVEKWMTELSNWGRWGKDDRLGAVNLITPEKRKAAAKLVKDGVSVSLAHDVLETQSPDNPTPFEHTMTATGGAENPSSYAMDRYAVTYHGFAQTHLDALCHVFHNGKMYNGVDRATATAEGCKELDVTTMRDGVQTSGILIDIPWLRGVDWLEPGTPIYPEELEAWEKKTGITVSPGDVVLLRTGRWARRAAKGAWGPEQGAAGLHISCAKWLKDRGVSILGSDAGSDVVPSLVEGAEGVYLPLHEIAIAMLGIPIIDNADLEAVSKEAQKRNRWEFLFTLAPLRVVGGTGSPANPIATF
jgi:kynurenine formamidase